MGRLSEQAGRFVFLQLAEVHVGEADVVVSPHSSLSLVNATLLRERLQHVASVAGIAPRWLMAATVTPAPHPPLHEGRPSGLGPKPASAHRGPY